MTHHGSKIIFLDIDGVLNCENAYRDGHCQYVVYGDEKKAEFYQSFAPSCKRELSLLIEETGADIVISSSWRNDGIEIMRLIWEMEQMPGTIIDITPNFRTPGISIPRGLEIDHWLTERGFYHFNWDEQKEEENRISSGISNYVIIDDDSDMLYKQRNNFVHVLPSPRNRNGFTEEHRTLAKNILNG